MKKHFFLFLFLIGITTNSQVVLQALDAPDSVIPSGWSIDLQPVRYLASVYDDNYYPMNSHDLSTQPATAQLGSQNANTTTDPLLNYQGKIGSYKGTTTAVQIMNRDEAVQKYVYAVRATFNKIGNPTSLSLPQILATATIPAQYIKNSTQDETVYLRSTFSTNNSATRNINSNGEVFFYISAEKDLELVQLDMNRGIGRDGKGILLTTFNLSTADSGDISLELRLLPGIPDRSAGLTTLAATGYTGGVADELEHEMFYMPIIAQDNKTWLGNNLGADYANLTSPDFNPLTQAGGSSTDPDTIKNDWKAFGSLFQWQRKADGHELVNWTGSTAGAIKYGHRNTPSNSWTNPNTNQHISNLQTWVTTGTGRSGPYNLWQTGGSTNPCPSGYHVPIANEFNILRNAIEATNTPIGNFTVNNYNFWEELIFRLPSAGKIQHIFPSIRIIGSGLIGYTWSSEVYDRYGAGSDILMTLKNGSFLGGDEGDYDLQFLYFYWAEGFSVRCIKD